MEAIIKLIVEMVGKLINTQCSTPHTGVDSNMAQDKVLETPNLKDGYYEWKKGEIKPINKYFNTREFTCQCTLKDCVEQKISKDLIDILVKIREYHQKPMTITSGFRCEAHQANLKKSGANTVVATKSQHCLGNAADALFKDLRINEWINTARTHSMSVGVATNFIHIDTRRDKKREWSY